MTAPQASDELPALILERDAFEALYPRPRDCIWCGHGFAATTYNAWGANAHAARWEGWKARARAAHGSAALAAPAVAPPVEFPDEGELEAWRSTADRLMGCRSDDAGLTRRAAHLLQNAYLFASKLRASPAVAQEPPTGEYLLSLVRRAKAEIPDSLATGFLTLTRLQLGWIAGMVAQRCTHPAPAAPEGYVLAPHYRGYAHLGMGQYVINHSAAGELPELIISIASEAETAVRSVGEDRDNPPGSIVQTEDIAVRVRFENVAGLDALEKQLGYLRSVHFAAAPEAAQEPTECDANGSRCSYTPNGTNGELQCKFCGAPPPRYEPATSEAARCVAAIKAARVVLDEEPDELHALAALRAIISALPAAEPPVPACAGDPGECEHHGGCMYACGRAEPPAMSESQIAERIEAAAREAGIYSAVHTEARGKVEQWPAEYKRSVREWFERGFRAALAGRTAEELDRAAKGVA